MAISKHKALEEKINILEKRFNRCKHQNLVYTHALMLMAERIKANSILHWTEIENVFIGKAIAKLIFIEEVGRHPTDEEISGFDSYGWTDSEKLENLRLKRGC
jgi:hypothetical protein